MMQAASPAPHRQLFRVFPLSTQCGYWSKDVVCQVTMKWKKS